MRFRKIAQCDKGCGIAFYNSGTFKANDCDKQTDTGSDAVFKVCRDTINKSFTEFKELEKDKNNTLDQYCGQGNSPRLCNAHGLNLRDNGKGEICV